MEDIQKRQAELEESLETVKQAIEECETEEKLEELTVEAEGIKTELDELQEQRKLAVKKEERKKVIESIKNGSASIESITNIGGNEIDMKNEVREQRGKELLEKRSVTLESGTILAAKHTSEEINPSFKQYSSLVDMVNIVELNGGESYSKSFEKTSAEGGVTAEGIAATTADTTFGYAEMNKVKITAYSEDTEEIVKLAPAAYDEAVERGVEKSLKKKIAKEIIVGSGAAGQLTGILNSTTIETSSDVEISAIDSNSLDEVVFSYGGEEDVDGTAVLLLNKQTLKDFAKVTVDGKKFYNVKSNGNGTGTIDEIPYVINSNFSPFATASVGDYVMAYGNLKNYELPVFSDVEISRSTDYKFKEGMVAHKGVTFVGGNVTVYNGFTRVKKSAVVQG